MVKVFIGLLFIILLGHSYHLRPLILEKRGVGLSSSSPGERACLQIRKPSHILDTAKKSNKGKSKERAYDILESGKEAEVEGGGEK